MKTKNNKNLLIITSVLCLLPMIFSAVVYAKLPEQILFLVINLVLTKMCKVGDPTYESQSRAAANWNKTHRLAGYVYVASGVILIVTSFLLTFSKKENLTIATCDRF